MRAAYGDEAYGRLQALKRNYDPDNAFHRNQNVSRLARVRLAPTSPLRRCRSGVRLGRRAIAVDDPLAPVQVRAVQPDEDGVAARAAVDRGAARAAKA